MGIHAFLRLRHPCARKGREEPYETLDDQISMALGLDSGEFYIEVKATPKPPRKAA